MIFSAKNEDNIPTWKLIYADLIPEIDSRLLKTVTRRLKPLTVGKSYAVQPSRGKKSVGKIRVVNCISHEDWVDKVKELLGEPEYDEEGWEREFDLEAHREGFKSWFGLEMWFAKHKIEIDDTFRIEFEVVDICLGCEHGWRVSIGGDPCLKPLSHFKSDYIPSEYGVKSCSEFKLREVV